jgi:hypothetical protein
VDRRSRAAQQLIRRWKLLSVGTPTELKVSRKMPLLLPIRPVSETSPGGEALPKTSRPSVAVQAHAPIGLLNRMAYWPVV